MVRGINHLCVGGGGTGAVERGDFVPQFDLVFFFNFCLPLSLLFFMKHLLSDVFCPQIMISRQMSNFLLCICAHMTFLHMRELMLGLICFFFSLFVCFFFFCLLVSFFSAFLQVCKTFSGWVDSTNDKTGHHIGLIIIQF